MNFGERLKSILGSSRLLAGEAHATAIDTEHQLVAVCAELEQVKPDLWRRLGLETEDVGRSLASATAPSAVAALEPAQLPYSVSAKASLEHAMRWRRELGHAMVEPEHLLVGLAGEENGGAGQLLRRRGLTAEVLANVLWDRSGA